MFEYINIHVTHSQEGTGEQNCFEIMPLTKSAFKTKDQLDIVIYMP